MEYEGIVVEQQHGGPRIVMFSAPALEIERWAGIPQRRRVDGSVETSGFQREEKRKRIRDIASFMAEPANVIQNPLLAAIQDEARVVVTPLQDGSPYCRITVSPAPVGTMTLRELIDKAMQNLKDRMPDLAVRAVDAELVSRLMRAHSLDAVEPDTTAADESVEPDSSVPEGADGSSGDEPSIALFDEESQVVDFYDELHARHRVLGEMGADGDELTVIGGFDREFLISLVRPVVLVDGQHRLKGAIQAIHDFEDSTEGNELVAQLVDEGRTPEEARTELAARYGRRLPVSLLLSVDPAEHVFQFVVVNQKATPMSNALLGTIVSTSLTQDELEPIRGRLRDAGIELEGSRAISYMRRAADSPFRGLVASGVAGDRPNALPWTVLGGLISIVRHLDGGTQYHPPTGVDYAKLWRNNAFPSSELVDTSLPAAERLAIWSENDGPWRTMFIKLFSKIRDKFGDTDDPEAHNYWGSTRSNLFNMVSLRILTVDWFNFLQGRPLGDWEAVDAALEEWIGDLNSGYFARDWRMGGTKKDQPTIKSAWSSTWAEYRLTRDRLPRLERYNPGGKGAAV